MIGSDRSHEKMWEAELDFKTFSGKFGRLICEAEVGGRFGRPRCSLSQSESQNSASHFGLTDRPPKFP